MCQKTISMWVAFTTQKSRPRVDWLINCIYAAIKMETIYNRNSQGFRNTADNLSIMYDVFSDYQIKRCLEFTRKLSWFSTLLFWNKTRGQNKTIIFLQNKGFPRRRRRPSRNCGVFWKGKFYVINCTRRTLLINWIELEVEIWQESECSTPLDKLALEMTFSLFSSSCCCCCSSSSSSSLGRQHY